MKILIVEDNKTIANAIQEMLQANGYDSDIADDLEVAKKLFKKNKYNLVLLDLMLPGGDGMDFCEYTREKTNIPIIITTSKHQLEDKLEGFDLGADDYLVKPFDFEELLARVKRLLERTNQVDKFEFEDVVIYLNQKKVYKNGEKVEFTNKEISLIECLLDHFGTAVSRTDIIDYIWGGDIFDNDNKLDVYISNIRRKLGKGIIKTVKGFGYKIEK
ncbi:response regulator transcription factor [Candidatus Absconditicoccus praedator]|uniref:response regulator transcription factor n=1 Tax=Candidatus Absconditicoccus praedator TaxID=2735562 RepID=UPI001E3EE47A|nr:response regulator transcription factor [Candidatus Absconditicoccus praedator]UFX83030.1 response regulator transcription factor [Candidatus Absconditicoccus praedator]